MWPETFHAASVISVKDGSRVVGENDLNMS